MIGIIDYGMGNLLSVYNAVEICGADVKVISYPEELDQVDKIILPGVGSFGHCMKNLKERGFIDSLKIDVISAKKPILGICLGMQVMAKKSYEHGEIEGLGWIDAEIIKIDSKDLSLKVPHVGWNGINISKPDKIFKDIPDNSDVYFVHSYHMKCRDKIDIAATCDYGFTITAAIQKGNLFATQFHPEKSQSVGLRILENFLRI